MVSIYERQARQELRDEGYIVDFKMRTRFVPRGYSADLFGAFDLMAYKVREKLRFIAIKGHKGIPGELRRKVESFKFPTCVIKEIWVYRKDGTIKKEIIK